MSVYCFPQRTKKLRYFKNLGLSKIDEKSDDSLIYKVLHLLKTVGYMRIISCEKGIKLPYFVGTSTLLK